MVTDARILLYIVRDSSIAQQHVLSWWDSWGVLPGWRITLVCVLRNGTHCCHPAGLLMPCRDVSREMSSDDRIGV